MNLIALLIGLVIERLATQLFHWRRMRWLDRLIDLGFRLALKLGTWPALVPVVLLADGTMQLAVIEGDRCRVVTGGSVAAGKAR